MKDAFLKLWEFHETYDCARSKVPGFPDKEIMDLRDRLLDEERDELRKAQEERDLVEVADAIGDMIYILIGTAVAYGIPIDEVFNEIHASNMSKLGSDGKPIYREDGKVLKGENYFKPDIAGILERYRNQ